MSTYVMGARGDEDVEDGEGIAVCCASGAPRDDGPPVGRVRIRAARSFASSSSAAVIADGLF